MQPSDPGNLSVVRYSPTGPVGRVVWLLVLLLAFVGTFHAGLMTLRAVHFVCDRRAATCSIVSSWGPVSTAQTFAIGSIKKTRLDSFHDKHGTTYRVALVTSDGDVPMSMVTSSDRSRLAQLKAEIDAFLSSTQHPTLDVDYDEPSAFGFLVLGLSLVWVLIAWVISGSARVEIDRAAHACTLVTVRWPLASKRRVYRLEDVRDAIVTESRGRRSMTYRVCLVIDGQKEPVSLVKVGTAEREPKDRVASEIRALLATASSPR